MASYPDCLRILIEEFAKMPGVGIRTAERLALYVLSAEHVDMKQLSEAILTVNESIRYCEACFNLSERDLCMICSDDSRDAETLCVVEEPKDILTLEKAGVFKGRYHVLLGVLSPLDGVGPQDLKVEELLTRIKDKRIKEVILGMTSDTEGEATALYLTKVLKALGVRTSRLAQGIPVGGDLEFADRATLMRAIEARHAV